MHKTITICLNVYRNVNADDMNIKTGTKSTHITRRTTYKACKTNKVKTLKSNTYTKK